MPDPRESPETASAPQTEEGFFPELSASAFSLLMNLATHASVRSADLGGKGTPASVAELIGLRAVTVVDSLTGDAAAYRITRKGLDLFDALAARRASAN